ncbi:hypothetical protein HYPSUDRAFT_72864 [Hypholoma sublateritium FD-334 SS-4]|uniref:Uncharacterized protein n=1 Tax=Hypholoma sublateritium (strain FD-334 SS-4) TaxID=945553 RepID=A0A0D2KGX1_HYPSF|nr:hypothetical protein HYPSUDRAFT_72864 [Hypholoma sublateritium FD-334 SS-4]
MPAHKSNVQGYHPVPTQRALVPHPGMLFIVNIARNVEICSLWVTVSPFADVPPALFAALRAEGSFVGSAQFKAIVFASTVALVDWCATLLAMLAPW